LPQTTVAPELGLFSDFVHRSEANELRTGDITRAKEDLIWLLSEKFGVSGKVPGFFDLAPIHRQMNEFIDNCLLEKKPDERLFMLILIPRFHLKSTVITSGKAAQLIIRNPNTTMLVHNAVWDKARKFLGVTKGWLKTDFVRDTIGLRLARETQDEITVARSNTSLKEPTIATSGLEKSLASDHYDWIIVDDLVNRENVGNEDQIAKVKQNYRDLLPVLRSFGVMLVIGCLTADSKVQMADGTLKRIVDVRPGEMVWSWDESQKKLVKKSVEAMIPQGQAPVFEVKTTRNTVKATGDHPILTSRGWVHAEDLEPGDLVLSQRHLGSGGKLYRVPDGRRMDMSFPWLLGFLMGDGWCGIKEHRGYVAFSPGVDEALNERARDAIEKWLGKRPYTTANGTQRVDSLRAAQMMQKMGLNGSAHSKRVPDWVFKSRASDKRAFLKGMVDADGSKLITGYGYRVEICNAGLVEDMRDLALACGVRPTGTYTRTRRIKAPHSKQPVDATSHSIGLTFTSHQKKDNKGWPASKTLPQHCGCRYDKVISVTPCGREEVYDLTVADTHNFIANGMLVHNTRWHDADLYGDILDAATDFGGKFRVLQAGATDKRPSIVRRAGRDLLTLPPDAKFLWPGAMNESLLQDMYTEMGSYEFFAQMYNETIDDDNATFKAPWIEDNYYQELPAAPELGRPLPVVVDDNHNEIPMNHYLLTDFAISEEQYADFSAFVVVGVAPDNRFYVRLAERMKSGDPDAIIKRLLDIVVEWDAQRIAVETKSFQKVIAKYLDREKRARGIWVPIEEMNRGAGNNRTKELRIKGLQPFFQGGQFRLKSDMTHLIDELRRFPRAKHDDLLDALADAPEIARIAPSVQTKARSIHGTFAEYMARQNSKRGLAGIPGNEHVEDAYLEVM